MLNQIKSVVYGFSLLPWLIGFVLVGKLASSGAVLGHLFFGAQNSESVASINSQVSATLGQLAQSAI